MPGAGPGPPDADANIDCGDCCALLFSTVPISDWGKAVGGTVGNEYDAGTDDDVFVG